MLKLYSAFNHLLCNPAGNLKKKQKEPTGHKLPKKPQCRDSAKCNDYGTFFTPHAGALCHPTNVLLM
ncbi:hypothetical protein XELAEV_18024593mg [Xenopus laevis]|uniref:Uncharacterized protein n=1 Tax=Xenopus laevis TaxID=8355 RepID=A0A974HL55_XENLA|nr:hypothetical protein XELAEV_18024593mg [Xenopus laevis]